MKRTITIELFEEHPNATFYVFRFEDEKGSEFDAFYDQFDGQSKFQKDLDKIVYWLSVIGNRGIEERKFRYEGGKALKGIPVEGSKLRLYCFVVSDNILLIGGGGEKPKPKRTYQEVPELLQAVTRLKKTGKKLLRLIKQGKIKVIDGKLTGKLKFTIENEEE